MGDSVFAECESLELRLPPATRFASVVRLIAASLAADEGFAVDALDELRIAVEQIFIRLVESEPEHSSAGDADLVLVRFLLGAHWLQVDVGMRRAERPWVPPQVKIRTINASGDTLEMSEHQVILVASKFHHST
jgi:hypothetical protein